MVSNPPSPKFPTTDTGIKQAAETVIEEIRRNHDRYGFIESERKSTTAIFMA